MFSHPFAYVMVATFIAAIGTLLVGMVNLAGPRGESNDGPAKASRSTNLMFLRVALCFALLVEIVVYLIYIKPTL